MPEITAVNEHSIDIEVVCRRTKQRLESYKNNVDQHGKKKIICRVSTKFHEIDESAYVPGRCSIGPYHNGDARLENMEVVKLSSLDYILKHFPVPLEKYYRELQSLEEKARSYYSEDISMDGSFLEMLLLDSCFILCTLDILEIPCNPADSINTSSSTGLDSTRNNGENSGSSTGSNLDRNNIPKSRERSEAMNPADSSHGSPDTGSNCQENNLVNPGVQIPNRNLHELLGEENLNTNNVRTSVASSDECNQQVPSNSIVSDLIHDLLLLENQIPFIIIERTYNVARGDEITPNENISSPVGVILNEFIQKISKTTKTKEPPKRIYHFLHLLHYLLRPSEQQNGSSQAGCSWLIEELRLQHSVIRNWLSEKFLLRRVQTDNNQQEEQYFNRWRRAAEYYETGVRFKLPRQPPNSPLDIEFKNGELRIPKLIIDEETSFIFGNLLAFEQETDKFTYDITAYITFMSQLLSMPEDVTLLSRKGVIEHHLGCDEDVSELFKNLTKYRLLEVGESCYLKVVYKALEEHYENHWNRWFAWLRHKHMTNPWLILGLVVAAIVAISAIVQAFFSVIPYVHINHQKHK